MEKCLKGTIKYVVVLYVSVIVPRTSARLVAFPALLQRTVKNAISAAAEFFSARLSNPHTRRAYARPVANFLAWVEQQRIELISMCRKRSALLQATVVEF